MIYTKVLGNCYMPDWDERLRGAKIDYLNLDQWSAQKSRLVATSEQGEECALALKRHTQLLNGDVLAFDECANRALVVRIRLNEVLEIDLQPLEKLPMLQRLQHAFELGHAIGNQHWPAVVRGKQIYVPLTVDRQVMRSVLDTHHIEGISYRFRPGSEIIPYLAPHEIRRLFGGAEHPTTSSAEPCHAH